MVDKAGSIERSKQMYNKITYYHTLYKRDVTELVTGKIEFHQDHITFSCMGHGQAVRYEYIKSIEPQEE